MSQKANEVNCACSIPPPSLHVLSLVCALMGCIKGSVAHWILLGYSSWESWTEIKGREENEDGVYSRFLPCAVPQLAASITAVSAQTSLAWVLITTPSFAPPICMRSHPPKCHGHHGIATLWCCPLLCGLPTNTAHSFYRTILLSLKLQNL